MLIRIRLLSRRGQSHNNHMVVKLCVEKRPEGRIWVYYHPLLIEALYSYQASQEIQHLQLGHSNLS